MVNFGLNPDMLKQSRSLLIICLIFSSSISQTPASGLWPLTADQNAEVTGNLIASPQCLCNLQVKYESGVQRSSPSGNAGSWPGESAENSTRYMQFAITPQAGYIFKVSSVSMMLYVNSGSNMRANIYYSTDSLFNSKTQIGSTYKLSSAVPTAANVTATLDQEIEYSDTFYVRIYPWYLTPTTGKYVIVKDVTVSGTTLSATSVLVSPTRLSGFMQVDAGTPSAIQTYSLTGTNLANPVVIFPPAAFEISIDSLTWQAFGDSIVFSVSDGNIPGQPVNIAVRLNATAAGAYEGLINHHSAGATGAEVALTGVCLAAEPTSSSTITIDSLTGTTATLSLNGGNGIRRIVTIRAASLGVWLPADGAPAVGVSADFTAATDQGDGTKIVFDGPDTTVTITGLTSQTTYIAAVFEYNVATGNSQNYLTSLFGIKNLTTLAVPTLSVSPRKLDFDNVLINDKAIKSYVLSGRFLQENGSINVRTSDDFLIALSDNSGFGKSLSISYPGQTIDTTIYVRFSPTALGNYSGSITHSGGAAETVSVALNGNCVSPLIQTSVPEGFASMNGGTTGGQGGDSVIVQDAQTLYDLMHAREDKSTEPLIVYISGTLAGYPTKIPIKRTGNISILGLGNDAGLSGFGMKIVECSNIIVRNLTFSDCHVDEKDALSVEESHNVWVDHCTFTDSPAIDTSGDTHDGLLDIKDGSNNVTVSYNHFLNHRKTCLLGHTASQEWDSSLAVTYYRNWFDGTHSRHPRARFGRAHIVNNLYTEISGYGIGVTCNAQVMVEANYFENTPIPVLISQINDPEEVLSGDPAGYIKARDNVLDNSGEIVEHLSNYHFTPSDYYSYSIVTGSEIKTIVQENAGAGKLDTANVGKICRENSFPTNFLLLQNYPNPFNTCTTILFRLPAAGRTSIIIYDLLGRQVATLFDEPAEAFTTYQRTFDASRLSGGVYFCVLKSDRRSVVNKMLLIK